MALSEDTMSKCSEQLSSYKSACEAHPDLKSFDSSLQQRTNKVIDSLTAEAEKRNNKVIDALTAKAEKRTNKVIDSLTAEAHTGLLLSQQAAHVEVCNHLHEVSQGVADFIVNSGDDVWDNKAVRSLVKAFLNSTINTIKMLDKIESYVDKAEKGQLIIRQAVAQFDKESADVGGKKKYEKTLKKLKKFQAMGDPFDGRELTTLLNCVREQQDSLLKEVSEARKKLQEEYDHLHQASVISNVVFGAGVALTAVASIALIATGVGVGLGIGLGVGAMLLPIGWTAAHALLQKRMDALKRQMAPLKELEDKLKSEGKSIEIIQNAMESVSEQVHQLETKISSMLDVVGMAIESEEEETRLAMNLIREKVKKLTEGIKEVGEAVSRSRKLIHEARYHVLEKMNSSA